MNVALSKHDDGIARACRSGSMRLMSLHWYVHQRPVHVSMLRMADRQKLEALKPSPYLSHREAEAAIRSASRRVLVLTYGRGCPDEPDPTGEVLKSLDRFVDWFIREFSLTPKDLKSYGLFWDFPSIVQRPQTADQERQRGNALDVMAGLYASPLATCVLQHVSVPTRPRDFEAKLLVFGVPATVTAEEVITPAETPYGRRDHVVVEKREDGAWLMTFDTHEAVLHAEVAVKRWAAKFDGGFATHAYNDRPYGERGWCVLEESLCREVVGRSEQRGFEEVLEAIQTMPIAKLYEISQAETPVPIGVEKPQEPEEVAEAIRSATFTTNGDKDRVLDIYRNYRRDTFVQAVKGNRVVSFNGEGTEVGVAGGAVEPVARALRFDNDAMEPTGSNPTSDAMEPTAEEMEKRRQRSVRLGGLLAALMHTLPLALIQVPDYAFHVFVVARFHAVGDEGFTAGATFIALSIACVWGAFIAMLCVGGSGARSHGLAACLLAPLNLHVLYFAVQHARLSAALGDCLLLYRTRVQGAYRRFDARLQLVFHGAHRRFNAEAEKQLRKDLKHEMEAIRCDCDTTGQFDEVDLLYKLLVGFKVLQTAVESVPLSILTAGALFGVGRGDAVHVMGVGLLGASLVLSLCSMSYGFFAAASQLAEQGFGEKGSLVQGRRASYFLALFVHTAWMLVALASCWSSASLADNLRHWLPGSLVLSGLITWTLLAIIEFVNRRPAGNVGRSRGLMSCLLDILGLIFVTPVALVLAAPLSIAGMACDVAFVVPGWAAGSFASGSAHGRTTGALMGYFYPIARRLSLLAMAAASLVDYSDAKVAVLASFQAADLVASYFLFQANLLLPAPRFALQALGCGGRPEPTLPVGNEVVPLAAVLSLTVYSDERVAERAAASTSGCLDALDMLDGLLLLADPKLEGRQHVVTRSAVRRVCTDLKRRLPTLSPAERTLLTDALSAYLPSLDGFTESELLRRLSSLTPEVGGALGQEAPLPLPRAVRFSKASGTHPVRGVPLSHVLQPQVWRSRTSFAGRTSVGSRYDLSYDLSLAGIQPQVDDTVKVIAGEYRVGATGKIIAMLNVALVVEFEDGVTEWFTEAQVSTVTRGRSGSSKKPPISYFVSHAWPDGGGRKLSMLRGFLFLQEFYGRILVAMPLLALFLLPTGYGVHSVAPSFPWWSLSALPLALLALLLAWVSLASLNVLPLRATPWAQSTALLWLDACCLDQGTPESIAAGIEGLPTFLEKSERMVAFVSANYFKRLWTVYELATFCRMHKGQLESRLLLLSLEWPSMLNPCKQKELTVAEAEMIAGFSCLEAQCYKLSDRAMLLRKIREQWGSEQEFDRFVQTELVGVMERSKAVYQGQLWQNAVQSFEYMFGEE